MDDFQSMEDKLRQLIPSSISEEGSIKLDETIDQLAQDSFGVSVGDPGDEAQPPSRSWFWKAAAAIAFLAVPVFISIWKPAVSESSLVDTASPTNSSQWVVLNSTNRIDGSESDGLIIPDDGSAPHYRYRYHVTDEEQVRDEKTGTVITLRQPRQEVVTVPVTQF